MANSNNNAPTVNNLQQLGKTVDGMMSKNPEAAKQFVNTVQQKYGIQDSKSLQKGMSKWVKWTGVTISGLAIANAITMAVWMGYKAIKSFGAQVVIKNTTFNFNPKLAAVSVGCMFLSFVFYKIMRWFMKKPTKTTESFNLNTKHQYSKMIAEVNTLNKRLYDSIMESALYESDQKAVAKIEATAEKSEGICKRMFNWIKEKFKSAIDWVKKHPWITLAIIIIIGFVIYYIMGVRSNNALKAAAQLKNEAVKKGAESTLSVAKQDAQNVSQFFTAGKSRYAFDSMQDSIAKAHSSMKPEEFTGYLKNLKDAAINNKDQYMGQNIMSSIRSALARVTTVDERKGIMDIIGGFSMP